MPTSVFTQAIAVVSRESLANAKVSTRQQRLYEGP